ncbi:MAG: alpha-amylase family glycosyl hydrolase [Pirellulales bacterium]
MPTTSTRAGMGAIPFPGGVTFRVWAPFANQVTVAGDFNGWNEHVTPLVSEGNGNWSVDVAGAASGQRYKFALDGRWKIDPRAKDVTNSVGDGVIVSGDFPWQVHDFKMPPWNELVIYEMHAATFPDNPVHKRELFDAVARDMHYLRDLGINAIELMPTHEFPGDDSWGYNPSHLFAVEDSYGGPESLKRLVDSAHAHGIAVILDVVYNHFGPNDLDTWQFDGWFQHWNGEAMGGIYFYNDWRAWTPWGTKNRPDFGRPEVRALIRDNALMWLEEFRLDGLRFDMTPYIRNVYAHDHDPPDNPNNLDGWGWNLLRWINNEINHRQPWKITIAEDMRQNPAITRSTSAGGAGFDSQWDDQFHHRVYDILTTPSDADRNMDVIRHAIERRYDGDAFRRVIYTESHDEVGTANGGRRLTEAIHPGHADSYYAKKRSTLGAALMLTTPGIPMLFQGQEILEWIPFGDTNRLDWDKYDRFRGIHTLYRDLIQLRRNWFNNTRGLRGQHVNVFHVNNRDKVLAFHRWQEGGPGDDVLVVLNFSNRGFNNYRIGFPRSGRWQVRFNGDWQGYDASFSNWNVWSVHAENPTMDGLNFSATIEVPPYSCVIFSQ